MGWRRGRSPICRSIRCTARVRCTCSPPAGCPAGSACTGRTCRTGRVRSARSTTALVSSGRCRRLRLGRPGRRRAARPGPPRGRGPDGLAGAHAGRGRDDALAPGGRRLLPGPGSGWRYQVGGLAAIIRTIEERIAAREWFMTPLWQPQYLNRVHRLRPLDDPRGVFPAGPGLVDREPRRVRAHPGSPAADPIHPRRRDGHGLRRQRRGGEHAAGRPTLDGAAPRSGAGLAQLIGTITSAAAGAQRDASPPTPRDALGEQLIGPQAPPQRLHDTHRPPQVLGGERPLEGGQRVVGRPGRVTSCSTSPIDRMQINVPTKPPTFALCQLYVSGIVRGNARRPCRGQSW